MSKSLKERLRSASPAIGTLLTVASAEVAEALALIGFDWIFIDLEHGSLSLMDCQRAIQAIGNRCFTLVRVPDGTPENIKRVLDMGCSGIIVPLVNTESYARSVVSLAKYPPDGERSIGLGRAQGYGLNLAEYLKAANSETAVVVQIEHRNGVANADAILAVAGVDAVFVGPYDLSGSMGLPGQVSHPEVTGAIDRVRAICAGTGLPFGIFCADSGQARKEIDRGAKLIAVGTDILHMAGSARAALEGLRES